MVELRQRPPVPTQRGGGNHRHTSSFRCLIFATILLIVTYKDFNKWSKYNFCSDVDWGMAGWPLPVAHPEGTLPKQVGGTCPEQRDRGPVFDNAKDLLQRMNEIRDSKQGKHMIRLMKAQKNQVFNHSGPLKENHRQDLLFLAAALEADTILETGFASATSATAFLESFYLHYYDAVNKQQRSSGKLHSIDPFQTQIYHNQGLKNVKDTLAMLQREFPLASHSQMPPTHVHHNNSAAVSLAELYSQGLCLDLFFIDSYHLFDYNMLELHFALQMLPIGGVLVLDDTWMKSVQTTISYALTNMPFVQVQGPYSRGAILLKVDTDKREWNYHETFKSY